MSLTLPANSSDGSRKGLCPVNALLCSFPLCLQCSSTGWHASGSTSFLRLSCAYVLHLDIPLSLDTWVVSAFWVLWVMSAVMNRCVQIALCVLSVLLGIYPEVESLYHGLILFNVLRTNKLFSTRSASLYPFYRRSSSHRSSVSPGPYQRLLFFLCWYQPSWCECVWSGISLGFWFAFPLMTRDVGFFVC